jgi:hypothetical protein
MIGNLHQRVGDDDPRSATSGTPSGTPAGRDRRAWARVLTTDVDVSQDGTVSPKSKGRLTGFRPARICWPRKTGAPGSTSASWMAT